VDLEGEGTFEELYIHEILEGKPDTGFIGICPLIQAFMRDKRYSTKVVQEVNSYLDFLLLRAKGEIPTGASYQRHFVLSHPDYKHDSVLSDRIAYDLIAHILEMNTNAELRD